MPSSIGPQKTAVAEKKDKLSASSALKLATDVGFSRAMGTGTQLLVSVRNVAEARLAADAGVRWIDLKNPDSGSLGAPSIDEAIATAEFLASRSDVSRSAALGELAELDFTHAIQIASHFPVVKVGLSGTTDEQHSVAADWANFAVDLAAAVLPSRLVLAAYADYSRAAAPSPRAVIELAGIVRSPYVLVDTFIKDGRGLLNWLSEAELVALRTEAEKIGAELVVAGSLALSDFERLGKVEPSVIAVRGAACAGSRRDAICPERIRCLLKAVS